MGMNDYQSLHAQFEREITQDDSEIRAQFLDHFRSETSEFLDQITEAFQRCRNLDSSFRSDERKAHLSSLALVAINLHMISFKLFLSGYPIPSGNLQRQVIETIALAILCSDNSTGVLDRHMRNEYLTFNAVRDLEVHSEKLKVNDDAIKKLVKERTFYNYFSHPSYMTLAHLLRIKDGSIIQIGAAFDPDKLPTYRVEIRKQVSLASLLCNVIEGISQRISAW
jgi:hypothetical protein